MTMHHNHRRNSSPWQEISIDTTLMDFAVTDEGTGGVIEQTPLYALVDRYSGKIVKYSDSFGGPLITSVK